MSDSSIAGVLAAVPTPFSAGAEPDFDLFMEHCNWVLERDPNYWRAYNNRAIAYLQLERFEESEADIARGQALQPGSSKLKTVKGMLLDETHPVTESIEIDERRDTMDDDEAADSNE